MNYFELSDKFICKLKPYSLMLQHNAKFLKHSSCVELINQVLSKVLG